MIPAVSLLVAALAVARITRLITSDFLTAGPRSALIRRLGTDHKISYLVTCPWCSSMWVASVAAPLWYWCAGSAWVQVPALALALSQAVGVMSSIGDGE